MSFFQKIKYGCDISFDYFIDNTANLLSALAALSCFASGIIFVCSYFVDQNFLLLYFVQAYGKADFNVNITTANSDPTLYRNNATNAVSLHEEDGAFSINMQEYLNAHFIRLLSYLIFSGGVITNILRVNLHLWGQGRKERRILTAIDFPEPFWREHGYKTIAAMIDSVSITTGSAGLIGSILHFQGISDTNWQYSYPEDSTLTIKLNNKTFPAAQENIANHYFFRPNINSPNQNVGDQIAAHIRKEDDVTARLKANISIVYGARFFHENRGKSTALALLPLSISLITYQAGRFFENKADIIRLKRIVEDKKNDVEMV